MQKSKTIVLLDIDYTIFNTDIFREKIAERLSEILGCTDMQTFFHFAEIANQKSREEMGHFEPTVYLQYLKQYLDSDVPLEELEKVYYHGPIYKDSLYKDTVSVLETLRKNDIEIGFFSTGHEQFQAKKVDELKQLFSEEKRHIFPNKLEHIDSVMSQYKQYNVYLVDDWQEVLKQAKLFNSEIITIWIKRKNKFENHPLNDFDPDYSVEDISEIIPLIIRG